MRDSAGLSGKLLNASRKPTGCIGYFVIPAQAHCCPEKLFGVSRKLMGRACYLVIPAQAGTQAVPRCA